MTIPNLIKPIKITIEKKPDATGARQDHLRREPINRVKGTVTFQIDAQVVWGPEPTTGNTPVATSYGRDNGAIGYVLVRTTDLYKLARKIEVGDKLIRVGPRSFALYIVDFSYHAQQDGDFQLEKWDFSDRPSNA